MQPVRHRPYEAGLAYARGAAHHDHTWPPFGQTAEQRQRRLQLVTTANVCVTDKPHRVRHNTSLNQRALRLSWASGVITWPRALKSGGVAVSGRME